MITNFVNAVKENIFAGFQFSKLPSEEPASGGWSPAKPAPRKSILRRTSKRSSMVTASEKQLRRLTSVGPVGRVTKPRYFPIRLAPGSAPGSRIPVATSLFFKRDNALADLKKQCASVSVQFPTPNAPRPPPPPFPPGALSRLTLKLSFSSCVGSDDTTLRCESFVTSLENTLPLANSTLISSVITENNNEESEASGEPKSLLTLPAKSARRYSPYQVVSIHPFIIRRKSKKSLLDKLEKNNKIAMPLRIE